MKAYVRQNHQLLVLVSSIVIVVVVGILGNMVLPGGMLKPQFCEIDAVVEVHPGESMASIAAGHGVTLKQVRMVNEDTDPGELQPGNYINLPACHS